jgi:hypothetical protein
VTGTVSVSETVIVQVCERPCISEIYQCGPCSDTWNNGRGGRQPSHGNKVPQGLDPYQHGDGHGGSRGPWKRDINDGIAAAEPSLGEPLSNGPLDARRTSETNSRRQYANQGSFWPPPVPQNPNWNWEQLNQAAYQGPPQSEQHPQPQWNPQQHAYSGIYPMTWSTTLYGGQKHHSESYPQNFRAWPGSGFQFGQNQRPNDFAGPLQPERPAGRPGYMGNQQPGPPREIWNTQGNAPTQYHKDDPYANDFNIQWETSPSPSSVSKNPKPLSLLGYIEDNELRIPVGIGNKTKTVPIRLLACPDAHNLKYRNFRIHCDSDFSGPDFRSYSVGSFRNCLDICAKTPNCVAVSYRHAKVGECYLKDELGESERRYGIWGARILGGEQKLGVGGNGGYHKREEAWHGGSVKEVVSLKRRLTCPEDQRRVYHGPDGTVFEIECGRDQPGGYMDEEPVQVGSFEECMDFCALRIDCVSAMLQDEDCFMQNYRSSNAVFNPTVWTARKYPLVLYAHASSEDESEGSIVSTQTKTTATLGKRSFRSATTHAARPLTLDRAITPRRPYTGPQFNRDPKQLAEIDLAAAQHKYSEALARLSQVLDTNQQRQPDHIRFVDENVQAYKLPWSDAPWSILVPLNRPLCQDCRPEWWCSHCDSTPCSALGFRHCQQCERQQCGPWQLDDCSRCWPEIKFSFGNQICGGRPCRVPDCPEP